VPSSDLKHAFDPESFRERGHRIVDRLADHLAAALGDPAMPVLPWKEPEAMLAAWPGGFSEHGDGDLVELLDRFLTESQHLHHPRFVGHQVAVPLPEAALAELAGRLVNNGMAIYEMGPVLWAMERRVIGWMGAVLGLGEEAGGVLTSGGTLGNLHALLAARRFRAGRDTWEDGVADGPPLAFLVPESAHYSIERAVRILGLGREGLVPVAVDAALRMDAADLEPALRRAEAAGRKVAGVVANACCTPTGTFDPLDATADFCEAHGLWMHVDGAHGACAALSPAHAFRVAGIGRADSVVWDAHKMLLVPHTVTAVLFRERKHAFGTFSAKADYLYQKGAEEEEFNLGHRTFECTRPAQALPLYLALRQHGTALFSEHVRRSFELAEWFGKELEAAEDFEPACAPESNIVCFRHLRSGAAGLDAHQAELRRRILRRGRFYLVQTRLPRGLFLRVTLIHPRTGKAELRALLEEIRAVSASLAGSSGRPGPPARR